MDLFVGLCLKALLCLLWVGCSDPGCVEVESYTEAVKDHHLRLRCISCKRRGETTASGNAEWYFRPKKNETFYRIYHYEYPRGTVIQRTFRDRIQWHGTQDSPDLQEASIVLTNISFQDAGTYLCFINRTFAFAFGNQFFTRVNKTIEMTVVPIANREVASIVSEILMYLLNVVLTVWLVIEMLYCYKKIAAAGEEAQQENASDYLAITSESKENCMGVQVQE
uniref:Sodium channel regulatory subunit beta-1 n=1 Tax=Callorhinchus milii TaxID=7868 RepID=V9LAZ9_CALMI